MTEQERLEKEIDDKKKIEDNRKDIVVDSISGKINLFD